MTAKVRTCLWFDGDGEAAAEFYVSLIPGSAVTERLRDPSGAQVMVVAFHLAGTPYEALNGGPHFKPSEAASIIVMTDDQAETDRLWAALTSEGGSGSQCGWLKDRFGVSWQIIPRALPEILGREDRAGTDRAWAAMLQMGKIDIAALEMAYRGPAAGD